VTVRVFPGETMPLHATALGKALLAELGDAEARRILGKAPLARYTPHTIVDPRKIVAQLDTIRTQGFAAVHEENILGIVSVGAAVRDAKGAAVAAISLAYTIGTHPSLSFDKLVATTVSAAAQVSRELGCPEDRLPQLSKERGVARPPRQGGGARANLRQA
jgi:DNA-binding IclR family transcriptional regulator